MAYIMSVKGPIAPDKLGITLSHAHLLINVTCLHTPPAEVSKQVLAEMPLRMDTLGIVHRDALAIKDNLILGDVNAAARELSRYKILGGSSLVEATPPGIGRDPVGLLRISGDTGVNVICSTGWYIDATHPPIVREKSIDELGTIMVSELTKGIGVTGIKAGVIKLAMSNRPGDQAFTANEEKVLRAAARAQAITGVALTIHPNRSGKHWHTYLDVIEQEGGRLDKCYASHMECYCSDIEFQQSVAERGVTLSFDQFGHEEYMDSRGPGEGFVTDRVRTDGVIKLVKAGYAKKMVLSNEVCFKTAYKEYGGYGYAHLLENILPELRFKGVTDEQINTMLVENPKRLLAF